MPNRTAEVSLRDFQQKLDACKTKIALQQLLAQSLLTEFESLSSDVESLKQTLGASLQETKFFIIESWRSGDSIRIAITK